MRNHLDKSSVAQCLDEIRLTGRLQIPGIFYLRRRASERKSSLFASAATRLPNCGRNVRPAHPVLLEGWAPNPNESP
jgi:hypothetical protein